MEFSMLGPIVITAAIAATSGLNPGPMIANTTTQMNTASIVFMFLIPIDGR
jgi:hypothetical protein